jgi:carboxymethylenebutenolidase
MTRLTARDFPPALPELYDFCAHGRITKRAFLNRAAGFAAGGLTALSLLAMLGPNYTLARQVAPDDPDIVAETIACPSPEGHGEVRAGRMRPAARSGPLPAIAVVHENRGLNPYIEDVTRRPAKAGFLAMAPDGLTSVGGYPGNAEKGCELQAGVDPGKLMNDFLAAVEVLLQDSRSTRRVGIIGFC